MTVTTPGARTPTPAPATIDRARIGMPPRWVARALATAACLYGLFAVVTGQMYDNTAWVLLFGIIGPAVALLGADRSPGLGFVVFAGSLILAGYGGGWVSQVAIPIGVILLFACTAFGSRTTVVLTGIAMVLVPVVGFVLWALGNYGISSIDAFLRQLSWAQVPSVIARAFRNFPGWAALVYLVIVVLPWGAGLAWRSVAGSRRAAVAAVEERDQANRETAYAQEIAHLRAGQTQLARDVHDVVGHSLAVILAQAQSAQYLGDDEVDKMRETLGHVADSARRSLGDVRGVLSGTREATSAATAGLDSLIAGVRNAGNEVVERVDGTPRPLPPELEQVAYRVVQEMLTNALKHGREGGPVWVRQVWPAQPEGHLLLEVHNLMDTGRTASGHGIGLGSMRDRLASVGGSLHVETEDTVSGPMYAARADLPLRAAEIAEEG